MLNQATRAALNFATYRARTEYLALRGDHAASLLRVRQPKDPFPIYERIREHGEIYLSRLGILCTVSQPLCRSVIVDSRFGALSPPPGRPDWTMAANDESRLVHPIERSLLCLDPPDHTRLRKLIAPWFTPRALLDRAPRIRQIIQQRLDKVAERGEFDLATDVSKYIPVEVLCDILGVPPGQRDRMIWWASSLVHAVDGPHTMAERRRVRTAVAEMTAFFAEAIERNRRAPGDNLISAALASATADEPVSDDELIGLFGLVFIAGQPTAACLLNNSVRLLLQHPEQKRLLLADPDIAANAVEEALRFDPSGRMIVRLAADTVTIRDQTIPQGAILINFIAGANRDPHIFADPQIFDITRANSREHVTFSGGVHHCIGAGLARLQAQIMIGEIFSRFPEMRLAARPTMQATRGHRSPASLPILTGSGRSVLQT